MARLVVSFALCSLAVVCSAEWTPVDGINDLDIVEQALHKVAEAKLSPEQKKVAGRAVVDVEKVVAEIKTDKNLTKPQKMQKVKGAIQVLQNLQSQWELSAVEESLMKIVELPHLSAQQRAAAKKIVADVEATVKEAEAGHLQGEAKKQRVQFAIQELQGLEHEWLNITTVSKVQALENELTAKKALLKKEEAELKLASLEKELAEKKLVLKKLNAEKAQVEAEEKQRKEDAAQQEMVSRLLATAKALAASKKHNSSTHEAAISKVATPKPAFSKNATLRLPASINAILSDLKTRENKVADSLARMDAEEKKREAKLTESIEAAEKAPADGKTDATEKGQKMLKRLLKQEHRKYLKARAVRESQHQELKEGIRGVEKGDVVALSHLMEKMQQESKSMQAKSKNFLY
jgi:hypothetical protein